MGAIGVELTSWLARTGVTSCLPRATCYMIDTGRDNRLGLKTANQYPHSRGLGNAENQQHVQDHLGIWKRKRDLRNLSCLKLATRCQQACEYKTCPPLQHVKTDTACCVVGLRWPCMAVFSQCRKCNLGYSAACTLDAQRLPWYRSATFGTDVAWAYMI